jgi:potassium-transporting ATPase KdpC subunit
MKALFSALRVFTVLTLITGVVYPLLLTGIAKTAFSRQANGSLLTNDHGQCIGSTLLAQEFKSPRYFWPRPSAGAFATVPSGASNLGPTSTALKDAISARAEALRKAHGLPADASVPEDMIQASGSGLDPHISNAAARFQVSRVCAARSIDATRVTALIGDGPINVLNLNIALDTLH